MPVVDVIKNLDAPSLTIVADFAAPVDRVWQLDMGAEEGATAATNQIDRLLALD